MENHSVTENHPRGQAAAALARIIEQDWPEGRKGQLPALLLMALCDLTASPESQGDEGWEPLAIAQEMVKLGAHWPALTEEDARQRINSHWKSLDKLWRDRSKSVVERLAGDGLDLEPQLEKLPGGGAGNRTRYRLRFYPVPASSRGLGSDTQAAEVGEPQSRSVVSSPIHDVRGGERTDTAIRYYVVPMWFTGSDKQQPIEVTMGSLMLIPFVAVLTVLIFLVIGVSFDILLAIIIIPAPFQKAENFDSSIGMLGIYVALFLALNLGLWMIQLQRNLVNVPPLVLRIPIFPVAHLLFELHAHPDNRRKQRLHIASYVANCPICGADDNGHRSIRTGSGGWRFPGRIVGRCAHAPQEHVWSFDHITQTGRFLR